MELIMYAFDEIEPDLEDEEEEFENDLLDDDEDDE
jgi:hypothetical protein